MDYVPTRRLPVHKRLETGDNGCLTVHARGLNGPVPRPVNLPRKL